MVFVKIISICRFDSALSRVLANVKTTSVWRLRRALRVEPVEVELEVCVS